MKRAMIALFILVFTPCCGKTEESAECPKLRTTGFGAKGCATTATPDQQVGDTFDIDTGLPQSTVGANYGQEACADQYLVEVDLTQAAAQSKKFFVNAGWTTQLPAQPCERSATMSVFGFDDRCWTLIDQVKLVGQVQGTVCHAAVESHTNTSQKDNSGTLVTAS